MWQIETMTSIIAQGGHALEDSDSDVCHIGIVDIIRIDTNVMLIIQEDYRISHVEHGGSRPPTQSTIARLPTVWGRSTFQEGGRYISCQLITLPGLASLQSLTSLFPQSVQSPISSNLPLVHPPISSNPPLVQPPTFLNPPSIQPLTSSDPPSVQPPTSSDPLSV